MTDVDPYTVMHQHGDAADLLNGAAEIFTELSCKINFPPTDRQAILNWMMTFERLAGNVVVPHETQEDASPRCGCGSRVLRSDVIVCADCGRWQ